MNKKIVLLIVSVVIIFSIVLVVIFGLKADISHSNFQVKSLVIVNDNGEQVSKVDKKDSKVQTYVVENKKDDVPISEVTIKYRINPDNASDTGIIIHKGNMFPSDAVVNLDMKNMILTITFKSVITHGATLTLKSHDNQLINVIITFVDPSIIIDPEPL